MPHSGPVYPWQHAVAFPLTTLLVTGLDLEALAAEGSPGSRWKARFKPHFNVCVVYMTAGHRTPELVPALSLHCGRNNSQEIR